MFACYIVPPNTFFRGLLLSLITIMMMTMTLVMKTPYLIIIKKNLVKAAIVIAVINTVRMLLKRISVPRVIFI